MPPICQSAKQVQVCVSIPGSPKSSVCNRGLIDSLTGHLARQMIMMN